MAMVWDHKGRRIIDQNGRAIYVPFLAHTEQVQRWVALGYSIDAAANRTLAFDAAFRTASDFKAAQSLIGAHLAGEEKSALSAGVDKSDPDFWRIARAARAYEFQPTT